MLKTAKGFTLIELLVVVSIIGVVSTIAVISLSNLQKSVRDTKRTADLLIVQSALEQYRADQGYYPTSRGSGSPISFGGKVYLNKIPHDPLNLEADPNSWIYRYEPNPVPGAIGIVSDCNNTDKLCKTYLICAYFEVNPPADSPIGCSDGSLNCQVGGSCGGGFSGP